MHHTISILGSTGSIGTQTLNVIAAHHPQTEIAYLSTNNNIELLATQVQRFNVHGVAIRDESVVKRFLDISQFKGEILVGEEGLCEAASSPKNSILMSALVGFSGVVPTLRAIERGIPIALANKETLVSAGSVIMPTALEKEFPIIAVDSEHSAILQCLVGESMDSIERVFITASGGPFRDTPAEQLANVTVEQALRHPNWSMGSKITVDSATLMNKGFEVIEACWLFGLEISSIDVVIHPQSIIHSMVQFTDGSIKAQMGIPEMNLPIHYALTWPQRSQSSFERLNFAKFNSMTFEQPDTKRFPCLSIAYQAHERGGTAPAIMNAANEVAVAAFLKKTIQFVDIPRVINETLDAMDVIDHPSLQSIIESDSEARQLARTRLQL